MGVVHKLKKEVIDFVILQKRKTPSLSCRQMAVLTSEKFKIQVSKSSVNTVIKNNRLSAPVGRRPAAAGASKKFQIPLKRKEQIRRDIHKAGLEKEGPSVSAKGAAVETAPAVGSIEEKGFLYEGMGLVFLKAAEWELSSAPVLDKLFQKYVKGPLPSHRDQSCAVLLYARMFLSNWPEGMEKFWNHGLRILNAFEAAAPELLSFDWVKGTPFSTDLGMEYAHVKEQLGGEVSRLKIHLENGVEWTLDPRLTAVWKGAVPVFLSSSMDKAMTMLSRCLVSNNTPAVFLGIAAGVSAGSSSLWFDIAASFEGGRGRSIKKAVVLDREDNPLAEFSVFPDKKRHFLIGLWPWQEEFAVVKEKTSLKSWRPLYDPFRGRVFYGQEFKEAGSLTREAGLTKSLRIFALSSEKEAGPQWAVVTNWTEASAQKIFEEFLLRWPDLGRSYVFSYLKGENAPEAFGPAGLKDENLMSAETESKDIAQVFEDFLKVIDGFCRKYYFGIQGDRYGLTDMVSMCCNIPGHCIRRERILRVILKPPAAYPDAEILRRAVLRVNESAVTDPFGRRLLVDIEF